MIAALVLAAVAQAGSAEDGAAALFDRGVTAHRAGEHAEAEALWRAVLDFELSDDERARVLYDLGNAAWRQGRALEAVGWYAASLRLDPRDADAWANLELARAEAGLEPADRGDLRSTVERLLYALRPAEARLLVLAALVLLAAALAGEALRGGVVWRRLAVLGALLVLLSLAPWLRLRARAAGDPVLVLAKPAAELTSEPTRGLPTVARVPAGEEVERIDALPGWVRVRARDGTRGWLPADRVFALRPGAGDA